MELNELNNRQDFFIFLPNNLNVKNINSLDYRVSHNSENDHTFPLK